MFICSYVRICIVCICIQYVTGFWKTDRIVTLGLFHLIGPANGYTYTLHIHSAIIRLGWLVCFLYNDFCQSCKFMTETMGPMEGATWKAWVWNSPQWWGDISYAIQACLGLWLALLGPIASPNSRNGEFNLPLASHLPPPPTLPPPAHPPPIIYHQYYYSCFEKSCPTVLAS